MADTKISALSAVVAASGIDEIHTNESGVSKKVTIAQIATFIGSSPLTVKALAANQNITSTTAQKVTGLDQVVGVGTWVFQYFIRYQSATNTTGIKLSANHSGGVDIFLANTRWCGEISTDASGNHAQAASSPKVMSALASRVNRDDGGWGTLSGVDTVNVDLLMVVEGLMVTSTSGDIQLWIGNEIAGTDITVMANSSLVLTKIA